MNAVIIYDVEAIGIPFGAISRGLIEIYLVAKTTFFDKTSFSKLQSRASNGQNRKIL